MLNDSRRVRNDLTRSWSVPSCYSFSKIWNFSESANWGTGIILFLLCGVVVGPGLMFGDGLILAGVIVTSIGFLAPLLLILPMLILGVLLGRHDYREVMQVESKYQMMSREDRKRYRKHLKAVYRNPDELSRYASDLFGELREDRTTKVSVMRDALQNDYKAVIEGKRIYEQSLREAKRIGK